MYNQFTHTDKKNNYDLLDENIYLEDDYIFYDDPILKEDTTIDVIDEEIINLEIINLELKEHV